MPHALVNDATPDNVPPSREPGALLVVASREALERLSDLSQRAGYMTTAWDHRGSPPDTLTLLRNRIAFIEVLPDWTGAIEVLCSFKAKSYSGLVVLLGGEDAATLERVHTVGNGLGLRMSAGLANAYQDAQVAELLAMPLPPAEESMIVFDVREALAKNWLEVWYQPQIELKRRVLCGAEALLRLRHPVLGLFPPATFVPSSDADPFVAMTAFVVASAGHDWGRLGRMGARLPISINASMNMMLNDALAPMVEAAWPVRASRPPIIVEIAEYETLGDVELARAAAERLRAHGARLSIDDFGSGLSGFARLRDLPSCEIKLDRGFVAGCSTNPRLNALCAATVSVARQFGVRATAEGVETSEDCAELERLGFECAQGYFFAKPMPFADFHQVLRKRSRGKRSASAAISTNAG